MGFMDKMKGALNAVTGGAAKVSVEFDPMSFAGEKLKVKITGVSTGGEVKSKGVFIDLQASEAVQLPRGAASGVEQSISVSKTTFEKAFPISGAFVLAANETKMWEGAIDVPSDAQPTFNGTWVKHEWSVRARIEATGNDPDSGFKPVRIGMKK